MGVERQNGFGKAVQGRQEIDVGECLELPLEGGGSLAVLRDDQHLSSILGSQSRCRHKLRWHSVQRRRAVFHRKALSPSINLQVCEVPKEK